MNILHWLQKLQRPSGRQNHKPASDFITQSSRLPVSVLLSDLDDKFGLDLKTIGQIITEKSTLPRDEILGHMLEWIQGADSQFSDEEQKYVPRLESLYTIVQIMAEHYDYGGDMAAALTRPLPKSIDNHQRSIASYIQEDDFRSLERLKYRFLG